MGWFKLPLKVALQPRCCHPAWICRTALPQEKPSEDCTLLPRPSHEALIITIIQYLVVKFLTHFRVAPPKILSPGQTLTLTSMTLDASRKLSRASSFFDIVDILKLVAAASSDFFDNDREKNKAARFIAELVRSVPDYYLNAALASLASNHPLLTSMTPSRSPSCGSAATAPNAV